MTRAAWRVRYRASLRLTAPLVRIQEKICPLIGNRLRMIESKSKLNVCHTRSLEDLSCFVRWLYTLYLAQDANFRLKLKDRGVKGDGELGPGWACFVHDKNYKAELPKHTDVVEVCIYYFLIFFHLNSFVQKKSSCQSTHQAISRATSRVNKGYTVTGVGSIICSRNGVVRGNGVADLQQGER